MKCGNIPFKADEGSKVQFNVSPKTIYCDAEELARLGCPIETVRGHGGGIRWLDGERGDIYTESEIAALNCAISLVPK